MLSTLRSRCARRSRRGVTLLELVVALALIGVVTAMVLPALAPPARRAAPLDDVVRAARGAAIARAQLLTLAVAADGAWSLHARSSSDTSRVLAGQLDSLPGADFSLQLTPTGACVPVSAMPDALVDWDVAACAPRRLAAPAS